MWLNGAWNALLCVAQKSIQCPALCGLEGDGWSCPVWLDEPGDDEVIVSANGASEADAFCALCRLDCGLGLLVLASPLWLWRGSLSLSLLALA